MSIDHRYRNNFGLLRLIFATMVVVSHAPELIDGNRSREILTQLFKTLSFGEVGVDGFFVISGYLITKSFMSSQTVLSYLKKRVLRIYPAFLVATIISIVLFAPLGGAHLSDIRFKGSLHILEYALLLQPPPVPAFSGTHYAILNGAMWTIAYEFRCYLLVILLGALGCLRRREFVLALTAAFLLALTSKISIPLPSSPLLYGDPPEAIRMTATFLVGAIFYLYRDVIRMNFVSAAAAAALVLCFAFSRRFAEPVLVVFGGYAVFYFALMARPTPLASITARYDISYGLYLYCWPIQSLLVYSRPDISPWATFMIAWTAAALCGLISWIAVERPIQRRVHGKVDRGAKTSQGSMHFRARTEHPSPGSESL